MPSALTSAELVAGLLVALLCAAVAGVFIRRRAIAGGRFLTLSALRFVGEMHWRPGLMRIGSARVEWFPLIGVTLRPRHTWERADLELQAPLRLEGSERIDLLPEAFGVRCRYGPLTFDLAVQPPGYTALRSWVEAAPPGSQANVA